MMFMQHLFRVALVWVTFSLVGCKADELRTEGWQGTPLAQSTNPCEGIQVPSHQVCSAPTDGVCAPPSITVRMEANVADTKGDVVVQSRTVCLTDRSDMTDAGTEPDSGECVPSCPSRDGWCGDDDGCGGTCNGSCGVGLECQVTDQGWDCINGTDECAWCSEHQVCEDGVCACPPPPEGYTDGMETQCTGVTCTLRQADDCTWDCELDREGRPAVVSNIPGDYLDQVCVPR